MLWSGLVAWPYTNPVQMFPLCSLFGAMKQWNEDLVSLFRCCFCWLQKSFFCVVEWFLSLRKLLGFFFVGRFLNDSKVSSSPFRMVQSVKKCLLRQEQKEKNNFREAVGNCESMGHGEADEGTFVYQTVLLYLNGYYTYNASNLLCNHLCNKTYFCSKLNWSIGHELTQNSHWIFPVVLFQKELP